MRHGIISTGGLVLAFSIGSWVGGPAPAAETAPNPSPAAVLDIVQSAAAPSTSVPASPRATIAPPTTVAPTAPEPAVSRPDPAADFLARLNELRAEEALAPLRRTRELDDLAQSWAEAMAADEDLRHSELIYDVIAGEWSRSGENIGYGPSAAVIFDALESSPGHLANMVDGAYTHVGVGVVRIGEVLWTAHLFAG